MYNNLFDTEEPEDLCYASRYEREEEEVDLGNMYKKYKTCKVRICYVHSIEKHALRSRK